MAVSVPARPMLLEMWSPFKLVLLVASFGLFAYVTGTWLAAAVAFYVVAINVAFMWRERHWNTYADGCEASFDQIGVSAYALSASLEAIATKIEAEGLDYAQVPLDVGPPTVTAKETYWASTSNGTN